MPAVQKGRPTKARELWLAKDPFLKALHDACHVAARSAGIPQGERERQVEDAFFRAAVSLEAFLSDWLARCLHFDTQRLATRAREATASHVTRELTGAWTPESSTVARTVEEFVPASHITMTLPKSISVQRARYLLGVENSNRSFSSAAEFKEWVGRYLAAPQARAASKLIASDDAVLNATIAIRNVIAHRSRRSEERLRDALQHGDLPRPLCMQQTVTANSIGRYLRVEKQGRPRFKLYFERLADIANKLAPYKGRPRTICP